MRPMITEFQQKYIWPVAACLFGVTTVAVPFYCCIRLRDLLRQQLAWLRLKCCSQSRLGAALGMLKLCRQMLAPKVAVHPEASQFDDHHSFIVRYTASEDLGLDMHTDDSAACLHCLIAITGLKKVTRLARWNHWLELMLSAAICSNGELLKDVIRCPSAVSPRTSPSTCA